MNNNMTKAFEIKNLQLHYGGFHALKNVNMEIETKSVTALIGPSGCGKSSLLRCLNRMNDLIDDCKVEGEILLDGQSIFDPSLNIAKLRTEVGMVFQSPNPFAMSIFENVAYGLRCQGWRDKAAIEERVEISLQKAALWHEVKDNLQKQALKLSGGQQQRLCIARAVALEPRVVLMDEPTSALDPIATAKIEELMVELKREYTIVIVTHSMNQAARISDKTGFFLLGDLIEYGQTADIFHMPTDSRTEDYISGKFG